MFHSKIEFNFFQRLQVFVVEVVNLDVTTVDLAVVQAEVEVYHGGKDGGEDNKLLISIFNVIVFASSVWPNE